MRLKHRLYACGVCLFALALTVSACGSSSKGGDVKKPAEAEGPPRAKSPIEALPQTPTVVFGVNVLRLRTSAIFKEIAPILNQQMAAQLKQFRDLCGVDLFEAVDSFVLAANTASAGGDDVTVVVSGMGRQELSRCSTAFAQSQGQKIELKEDGEYTQVLIEGGETVWLGWIADETFVMRTGKDKSVVEPRVRGEQSLTGNQSMMALLGKVSTEASLWVIAAGADMDPNIRSIHATADTTAGLKIDAGVETLNPESASQMAEGFKQQIVMVQQMAPVAKYLAKTQISAKDSQLFINLDLTEAEVIETIRSVLSDPMLQNLIAN